MQGVFREMSGTVLVHSKYFNSGWPLIAIYCTFPTNMIPHNVLEQYYSLHIGRKLPSHTHNHTTVVQYIAVICRIPIDTSNPSGRSWGGITSSVRPFHMYGDGMDCTIE
jgi:hypothetical protein